MMAIVYTDALLAVPFAHLRMTNRSMRYAVLRMLFVGDQHRAQHRADRTAALGRVGDLLREPGGEPLPPRAAFAWTSSRLVRPALLRGGAVAAALGLRAAGDAGDARGDAGRERRSDHAELPAGSDRGARLPHDREGRGRHLQLQLQAGRGDAAGRADVPPGLGAVLAAACATAGRAGALLARADGADAGVRAVFLGISVLLPVLVPGAGGAPLRETASTGSACRSCR